ncbi:unnamed protein product [Arctia plantaginis]|uniref:Carboxylesterase type B domain-containing protein n=1 Tax=Arctia plantaginis TaxID=874455 RepID=A0A8S1A551_ARCPL|nr:unnamed protein product [Arctia plantaginis]
MKWFLFAVSSLIVAIVSGQSDSEPPDASTSVTVTTVQGTVKGFKALDGEYFQFYGIPYADSPAGEHRFKAPRAPPSFEGIFTANQKDIKCVRALGVGYEGTEDCLVANVFTPRIGNAENLPVMVWIQGREFDGRNEYELSFRNFMEKDVIVVSLNYRESVLGFLCLGTETAPGNAGLKDIIAGLKWIQENIAQFGGNPNNITLFGHGSGGAAVDLITLSPMANGLINKAIAQSGNAVAPWAVSRDNLKYAIQIAESLGHIITDIEALSELFTRISAAALMGAINELDILNNALAFAPCVERETLENSEPFLTQTPSQILETGNFLKIPFITGFVDTEGTIRAQVALEDDWLQRMNTEFESFIQSDLQFESEEERSEIANKIRKFYFQDDEIDLSTIGDYIAYHGDTMILVSSIRDVRARAKASSPSTYLYQFSYRGAKVEPSENPLEIETAGHGEELLYLFHGNPEGASNTDLNIAQILVERWTNFAKTGNPTSETSSEIWQPFTTNNGHYLRILASDEIQDTESAPLQMPFSTPHPQTLTFWDEIYSNHFQDAESNWNLNERDEQDTTTSEPEEDYSTTSPPDNDTTDAPDSASTVVGYTFLIMTLFSILNRFHLSVLVSHPTSETSPQVWQPFTTNNSYYLRILASDEIQDMDYACLEICLVNPHPDTLTFWDEIYSNQRKDAKKKFSLNKRREALELYNEDSITLRPNTAQITSDNSDEILTSSGSDEDDRITSGPEEGGFLTLRLDNKSLITSDPGEEDSGTSEPNEKDLTTSTSGRDEENSTSPEPDEEESASPRPDEEDSARPGPDEEDSASPGPGEEDSATTESDEEESTSPGPDEEDSTSPAPDEEDSTISGPDEEDSASPRPDEEDSATTEPDGEDSITSGPNEEDSSSQGPDEENFPSPRPDEEDSASPGPDEEGSATTEPDGEDSTTSGPDEEDFTSPRPDEHDSATTEPDEEDSTSPGPDEENFPSPRPDEEDSASPGPDEEGSATIEPDEEDSTVPGPGEEDSASPRPDEDDSATIEPDEEDSTVPGPDEEDSASPRPDEEDSATTEPDEEDSTSQSPDEEDSTSPRPDEDDSATIEPDEEDSNVPGPEEEDSASPRPDEEDSATTEPDGEDSTTSGPDEEDSTSPRPDEDDSATIEPDEEDSTVPGPDEEDSASPRPDEEDSATTEPDGEDSTTSGPDEEDSTSPRPDEDDSATIEPDEEDSTVPGPEEEDSASPRPDEEDSATTEPDGEDSTTQGPEDENSTTSGPDDDEMYTSTTLEPNESVSTTEAPGSASRVGGYTFLIMTIFSILDKFYSSVLVY